jgi:hypothetical protein
MFAPSISMRSLLIYGVACVLLCYAVFLNVVNASTSPIKATVSGDPITVFDVQSRADLLIVIGEYNSIVQAEKAALEELVEEKVKLQLVKQFAITASEEEKSRVLQSFGQKFGDIKALMKNKNISWHTMDDKLEVITKWTKLIQNKFGGKVPSQTEQANDRYQEILDNQGEVAVTLYQVNVVKGVKNPKQKIDKIFREVTQGNKNILTIADDYDWLAGRPVQVPLKDLPRQDANIVVLLNSGQLTKPIYSQGLYKIYLVRNIAIKGFDFANSDVKYDLYQMVVPVSSQEEADTKFTKLFTQRDKISSCASAASYARKNGYTQSKYTYNVKPSKFPEQFGDKMLYFLEGQTLFPMGIGREIHMHTICKKKGIKTKSPSYESVINQLNEAWLVNKADQLLRVAKQSYDIKYH